MTSSDRKEWQTIDGMIYNLADSVKPDYEGGKRVQVNQYMIRFEHQMSGGGNYAELNQIQSQVLEFLQSLEPAPDYAEQRAAVVEAVNSVAPNRPIKHSLELKPCDVILGDWSCDDNSPTGKCAYDKLSFNGTDSCLFCCEPRERK